MPDPQVSIIVCTRDRPDQLLRCIESIATAAGRAPDFPVETIVLENRSQPHLALDAERVRQAGEGVRFFSVVEGGLAHARNVGMNAAKGRLFVFTDDDCVMDPAYLLDLQRHTSGREGGFVLGGRVKLADPDDLPFTIKDEDDAQVYDPSIHPGGFIQGCNFVVPLEAAQRIGAFDARFGAGGTFLAGEDTDYFIRARLAGMPIEYVPDMHVLHRHGRKHREDVVALNRSYSFANGALYAKYIGQPWLLKHLYWAARAAFNERFGGRAFNTELRLSWGSVFRANLAGAFAYATQPRPTPAPRSACAPIR